MLVAFLLAAAAHAADPLQSAFAAAHRDYMAQLTDKFADATASRAVIGQPFKLLRSLQDGDAHSGAPGGPYYTYADGKLRLVFILDEKYVGPGIEGPKYWIGMVGGRQAPMRGYVGSNAFGATRHVEVEQLDENGLAMLDRPEGEENPYQSKFLKDEPAIDLPALPKDSYWLELPLPAPEARRVAMDAALVVEGTIQPLDDGKLNVCKSNYSAPEIDAPIEVYGSECWVGANVRRIAFIRKSTGEVLKEWAR